MANSTEDLFVESSLRGRGLGRRLIESVGDVARSKNCLHVAWTTQHDNITAQRLYNTMATSEFKEYRMELS